MISPVQLRPADIGLEGVREVAYVQAIDEARRIYLASVAPRLAGSTRLLHLEFDHENAWMEGDQVSAEVWLDEADATTFALRFRLGTTAHTLCVGRSLEEAVDSEKRKRPLTSDELLALRG